jgi:hypothetical protein
MQLYLNEKRTALPQQGLRNAYVKPDNFWRIALGDYLERVAGKTFHLGAFVNAATVYVKIAELEEIVPKKVKTDILP